MGKNVSPGKVQHTGHMDTSSWRSSKVFHDWGKVQPILIKTVGAFNEAQVRFGLRLTNSAGFIRRVDSGFGGEPGLFKRVLGSSSSYTGQVESPKNQGNTYSDKYRRPMCVIGHPLRCRVHALLGDKVFYFPLLGFILCALAGLGGAIGFHDHNGKRHRNSLVAASCSSVGRSGLVSCS